MSGETASSTQIKRQPLNDAVFGMPGNWKTKLFAGVPCSVPMKVRDVYGVRAASATTLWSRYTERKDCVPPARDGGAAPNSLRVIQSNSADEVDQ